MTAHVQFERADGCPVATQPVLPERPPGDGHGRRAEHGRHRRGLGAREPRRGGRERSHRDHHGAQATIGVHLDAPGPGCATRGGGIHATERQARSTIGSRTRIARDALRPCRGTPGAEAGCIRMPGGLSASAGKDRTATTAPRTPTGRHPDSRAGCARDPGAAAAIVAPVAGGRDSRAAIGHTPGRAGESAKAPGRSQAPGAAPAHPFTIPIAGRCPTDLRHALPDSPSPGRAHRRPRPGVAARRTRCASAGT